MKGVFFNLARISLPTLLFIPWAVYLGNNCEGKKSAFFLGHGVEEGRIQRSRSWGSQELSYLECQFLILTLLVSLFSGTAQICLGQEGRTSLLVDSVVTKGTAFCSCAESKTGARGQGCSLTSPLKDGSLQWCCHRGLHCVTLDLCYLRESPLWCGWCLCEGPWPAYCTNIVESSPQRWKLCREWLYPSSLSPASPGTA